jgi:uncharacterized protein YpmS
VWLVLILVSVVVVFLIILGKTVADGKNTNITSSNSNIGIQRMTSRRKLREILSSEYYDTLNDWEKHFCSDVNTQKKRLTFNQAEKIDEIWSGIKMNIKMDAQYAEDCTAATKMLKEIIESDIFETLPNKEKNYIQKIYNDVGVTGSYRIRRIRDLYDKLIKKGK